MDGIQGYQMNVTRVQQIRTQEGGGGGGGGGGTKERWGASSHRKSVEW